MGKPSRKDKPPPLPQVMTTPAEYENCATRLKALADPERLRIVQALFAGPKNVSQLAQELADDVVKVSHHLGVLRNANLVRSHREGKFVVYSLDPQVAEAETDNPIKTIDLGCCQLDLPEAPDKPKE